MEEGPFRRSGNVVRVREMMDLINTQESIVFEETFHGYEHVLRIVLRRFFPRCNTFRRSVCQFYCLLAPS